MRNLSTIFLFLFLISCSKQPTENHSAETTTEKIDSSLIHGTIKADTLATQHVNATTDRFLKIVKFIDSSGYSFDTTRAYGFRNFDTRKLKSVELLFIDNYVFYDIPYQQTIPYYYMKEATNDTNHFHQEFYQKFLHNSVAFENAQKIVGYFFTQKKPTSTLHIDGTIEEWTFSDSVSAKQASEVMGDSDTQAILFFNCGAFVCYIDNYMYVFHTRAAGFMYSIKPIFKNFVTDNEATVSSKGSWKFY